MNNSEKLAEIQETNLEKYRIVVWNDEGIPKREIARRLGIDPKKVHRVLEKFDMYGSVEKDLRPGNSGRSPIFTEESKDQLRDLINNNDPMELEEIRERVQEVMEIEASSSTMSRVLKEICKHVVPTWTPLLTNDHKRLRLEYCEGHIQSQTNFRNVIFTDEARFYLNRNTKKVYVVKGERTPQKAKLNSKLSIMVWGSVCYKGKVYLEVVTGNLRHDGYINILERFLDEGVNSFYENRAWRLLQDGAPAHRARKVSDFLVENRIRLHRHPANSPDLNPIELIWALMKNKVEALNPYTKQQLEDAIFQAWEDLPDDDIRACIDRLPGYLHKVVEVNGELP